MMEESTVPHGCPDSLNALPQPALKMPPPQLVVAELEADIVADMVL